MQTYIHLPAEGETGDNPTFSKRPAFEADIEPTYFSLGINDGDGGVVTVFVETALQARQLADAALALQLAVARKAEGSPVGLVDPTTRLAECG